MVKSKILFLMMLGITLLLTISMISAMDFDNIVQPITLDKDGGITLDETIVPYNPLWERYAPIKIDNAFGLPLIGDTLVEGYLDKNTESCGSDCNAEFVIKTYGDSPLVDDIRFLKLDENENWIESSIRSYKVLIKTNEEEYQEEVYEWRCNPTGKISANGTIEQVCSNVKTGIITKTRDIWEDYQIGKIVDKGVYTIRIEGDKKPEWTYDWQIKTQGKWLENWAVWGYGAVYIRNATASQIAGTPQGSSVRTGWLIKTNQPLELSKILVIAGVTSTEAGVAYGNKSIIATTTDRNDYNFSFTPNVTLLANTEYYIFVNATATVEYQTTTTPIVLPEFNITYTLDNGGGSGWGDNYTGRIYSVWGIMVAGSGSYITLNSPINYYNSPSQIINVNSTINIVGASFVNKSLYTNKTGSWIRVNTTTNADALLSYNFGSDGNYKWGIESCDSDGDCGWSENRTISIDTTAPTVSITYPTGTINGLTNGQSLDLNYSASDTNLDSCWKEYNGVNTTIGSCANTTFTYVSGVNSIKVWANDSVGNVGGDTESWTPLVVINNIIYNPTATILAIETFSLNVTGTVNSAYLVYNNTYYTTTITDDIIYSTLNIPSDSIGNISFYFELNSGGTIINTLTYSQIVNNLVIQDCASGGSPIINLSIKDEGLNSLLNVTSPNTNNVQIQVLLGESGNQLSYSTFWDNNQTMAICLANLTNSTYRIDAIIGFSATDHVYEFWYLDNGILNLSSSNFNSYTLRTIDLMDLLTTDSTTFLFSLTDADQLAIPSAIIHVYRKDVGNGVFNEVERAKQDSLGQTHLHLVEEDVIYYFMATLDGVIIYTSDQYSAKCLSTPCSIELSLSRSAIDWDIYDNTGGLYSVSSNKNTRLVTTSYQLSSIETVNISLYSFENGQETLINSSSRTASGGSISLPVPLAYGNKTFFVSIANNEEHVKSEWVDLTDRGRDYFGTAGALLGGIIVLALLLMAITEGVGAIIFTCIALIIIAIMKLVDLSWMALISIICAGAIIIFKLVNRRNKQG